MDAATRLGRALVHELVNVLYIGFLVTLYIVFSIVVSFGIVASMLPPGPMRPLLLAALVVIPLYLITAGLTWPPSREALVADLLAVAAIVLCAVQTYREWPKDTLVQAPPILAVSPTPGWQRDAAGRLMRAAEARPQW